MRGTIRVPGAFRLKLFLLHTGISFSTSGASVLRMQHLRAVVRQLGSFVVRDLIENRGIAAPGADRPS